MTAFPRPRLSAGDDDSTGRPRRFPRDTYAAPLIDRMPPHDLAAEAGVLGSMIIDGSRIGSVCQLLPKASMFFKDENQVVFQVLLELFDANSGIDAMILHSALKTKNLIDRIGGFDYLKELAAAVPTSAHAEYYAAIVREKAVLRSLITACTSTLRDCYESGDNSTLILDRGEQRILDVSEVQSDDGPSTLSEILHVALDEMEKSKGESMKGLPSGFIELDNLTSGLQPGQLVIVGGRPSHGKTAIVMSIAEHVAVDKGIPVAVFSLEMTRTELSVRMLSSRSGVTEKKMRMGMLSEKERRDVSGAVGKLAQAPIYVDDSPSMTLFNIRAKARRMHKEHGVKLIVIDYLQLIEAADGENRQQQIAAISRGLKTLARELKVTVLVPCQLNRKSEEADRLPRPSDLRESGAIEQDADVVMLIHRESVAHRGDKDWKDANPHLAEEADLVLAKQRNGPCNNIKLTFKSEITRFINYNPGV